MHRGEVEFFSFFKQRLLGSCAKVEFTLNIYILGYITLGYITILCPVANKEMTSCTAHVLFFYKTC